MPVGGAREKKVSVRVVAATNQNLHEKIDEGLFREDLYFRLARFRVEVPPLRHRREDIPLLINHFLNIFAAEMRKEKSTLSQDALSALMEYHFPGNIRELKNIIESALIKSSGSTMLPEHLHFIDDTNKFESNTASLTNSSIEQFGHSEQTQSFMPKSIFPIAPSSPSDEEQILAYIKQNGGITNTECRSLLSVDRRRASYLLEKMHTSGLLARKGARRWTKYYLTAE